MQKPEQKSAEEQEVKEAEFLRLQELAVSEVVEPTREKTRYQVAKEVMASEKYLELYRGVKEFIGSMESSPEFHLVDMESGIRHKEKAELYVEFIDLFSCRIVADIVHDEKSSIEKVRMLLFAHFDSAYGGGFIQTQHSISNSKIALNNGYKKASADHWLRSIQGTTAGNLLREMFSEVAEDDTEQVLAAVWDFAGAPTINMEEVMTDEGTTVDDFVYSDKAQYWMEDNWPWFGVWLAKATGFNQLKIEDDNVGVLKEIGLSFKDGRFVHQFDETEDPKLKKEIDEAFLEGQKMRQAHEARIEDAKQALERKEAEDNAELIEHYWSEAFRAQEQVNMREFLEMDDIEVPPMPEMTQEQKEKLVKYGYRPFYIPEVTEDDYPAHIIKPDWTMSPIMGRFPELQNKSGWRFMEIIEKPSKLESYPNDLLMKDLGINSRFEHPHSGGMSDLASDLLPRIAERLKLSSDDVKLPTVQEWNFLANYMNYIRFREVEALPDLGSTNASEWTRNVFRDYALIVGDTTSGGLEYVYDAVRQNFHSQVGFRTIVEFD